MLQRTAELASGQARHLPVSPCISLCLPISLCCSGLPSGQARLTLALAGALPSEWAGAHPRGPTLTLTLTLTLALALALALAQP